MAATSEQLVLLLEVLGPNAQVQDAASEIAALVKMMAEQKEKDLIVFSFFFEAQAALRVLRVAEIRIARDVDRIGLG
jgi:uncharacterized protein with PhoU and TrkA domain